MISERRCPIIEDGPTKEQLVIYRPLWDLLQRAVGAHLIVRFQRGCLGPYVTIYSPFTGCEMVHHQTIQLMELSVDGWMIPTAPSGPCYYRFPCGRVTCFPLFLERERLRFCDRDWGMGHWLKTVGWDSCVKLKSL